MADLVESILREEAEKESKYKTISVEKDADVEIDEGNLLACDPNPIDIKLFKSNKNVYINDLARDNTQLLFNQLWTLPVEKADNTVLAKLPRAKTLIPREKRLPKPRPETKWEKFAKAKGIHKNTHKDKMAWDEQHKEFRPRYGYNRANDDTKDWLIEMKPNADDDEDPFEKRITARKERRAKNELQRLRNIARSQYGGKVPGVGLTPVDKPNKDQLGRALVLAKKSTASLGKFTEKLPKEKNKVRGKKRKFEPCVGDMKKEKDKQLKIVHTLSQAVPVNVAKAASQFMSQEPDESAVFSKEGGRKKRGDKPMRRSKAGGRPPKKNKGFQGKGGKGGGKGKGK